MLSTNQIDGILDRLIKREGGYVHHPRDPGGETKYGISKRSYPQEDIKNLTKARAKQIYKDDYLLRHNILLINDAHVAEVLLDWIVNSGPSPAIKCVQRLLQITVDGKCGKQTIEAINNSAGLAQLLLRERLIFMCRITKHPFIVGWVKRLVELGL